MRDLDGQGFYTDRNASVRDEALYAASAPLADWLAAIQRPTERWVALRETAQADCALALIEAWAEAGALLGRFNRQGAYHRKWTLAGVALAWLALRDAPAATPERQARIGTWLAEVGRTVAATYDRPPPRDGRLSEVLNNHVAWAGLAVGAAGVGAGDRSAAAPGHALRRDLPVRGGCGRRASASGPAMPRSPRRSRPSARIGHAGWAAG
jgi:poly(beta-D-mannuronate) lyase